MKRATFTIVTEKTRFDASAIFITREADNEGSWSVINFICSGSMQSLRADEVKAIEFWRNDASWCGACDGDISQYVGKGIHANAAPPERT